MKLEFRKAEDAPQEKCFAAGDKLDVTAMYSDENGTLMFWRDSPVCPADCTVYEALAGLLTSFLEATPGAKVSMLSLGDYSVWPQA